ncbi:MAG: phosphoglycerate dehydrogenase [bacterium]
MFLDLIAITSSSFCKNEILRKEISAYFKNIRFNNTGKVIPVSDLPEFLQGCSGAIIGLEQITDDLLGQLSKLRIISKYGVGLDNIDLAALEKRGILLGWTPGVNKRSVAELVLCFMLGLQRNIFFSGFQLKQGKWIKDGGWELTNKTVGIIGCGNIGKELVPFLKMFGCRIIVNDILTFTEFYANHEIVPLSLDDLLQEADIVSLHVSLTEETHHLISAPEFKKMKRSAVLINTSRGDVVDEMALKEALKEGLIRAAALDVFHGEPPVDLALLSLPNLMVTPHIGGNALEAVLAMGRSAIDHLVRYFSGGEKNSY